MRSTDPFKTTQPLQRVWARVRAILEYTPRRRLRGGDRIPRRGRRGTLPLFQLQIAPEDVTIKLRRKLLQSILNRLNVDMQLPETPVSLLLAPPTETKPTGAAKAMKEGPAWRRQLV